MQFGQIDGVVTLPPISATTAAYRAALQAASFCCVATSVTRLQQLSTK